MQLSAQRPQCLAASKYMLQYIQTAQTTEFYFITFKKHLKNCPEPLDAPAISAQGFNISTRLQLTLRTQVKMWTYAEIWHKAVVLQKSWDKAKAPK